MADINKVNMGACEISFDKVNLGYTKGGVKVTYSMETYEKTVDQETLPVDEIVTSQTFEVTVPIAEYNLPKLVKFFPGATLMGNNNGNSPTRFKMVLASTYGESLRDLARELVIKPIDGTPNDWITVYSAMPKPNFDFSYEQEGVRVYSVTFKALPAGEHFVTFGDTLLTSSTPGFREIESTARNVKDSWYNEPERRPVAEFSIAVDGTDPHKVTVNFNEAKNTGGEPDDYIWDFGDGNLDSTSGDTVVHTYASPGTYKITLIVSNSAGEATKSRSVNITSDNGN
ncbi:MAG: PKD domain-containing protein [Acidobacteriota bacterium]